MTHTTPSPFMWGNTLLMRVDLILLAIFVPALQRSSILTVAIRLCYGFAFLRAVIGL